MKSILEKILAIITRLILLRQNPKVVAVVGSVGKTSAKEAIYTVISSKNFVRKAQGSYNNEIGVPLTIIGTRTQGKNILGWFFVFLKSLAVIIGFTRYPEVLVLEFGEGKPGDIEYLMKLVRPNIVVLTSIDRVHLEYFKNIESVAKELGTAVRILSAEDSAIINIDNDHIDKLRHSIRASVTSIGIHTNADIKGDQIATIINDGELGLRMKVEYQGTTVPLFLPRIIAHHQAYAILLACGVGLRLGMNMVEIGKALKSYHQPKGRTNLVDGIHGSILIDDTYNASPIASKAALAIFDQIPIRENGRKIAVFGDMLELGDYTDTGHREVGEVAYKTGIDELITVGSLAGIIADGARDAGMSEDRLHRFNDQKDAIEFLQELIAGHDIVLIKGSQGARMERVVLMLMNDPRRANKVLVRQSKQWLNIA